MSWLIDRPSPVPSPEGLVVKNGLKIFSFDPFWDAGPVVANADLRHGTLQRQALRITLDDAERNRKFPAFAMQTKASR